MKRLALTLVLFFALRLCALAQVQASFSLNFVNGSPSTVPWTLTKANPGVSGQLTVSNAGTATTGIFGIARENLNPGTGIVSVVYSGLTYCVFDTATVTQLNYVVASGSGGLCHQVTSYPTTTSQVIGRVVGAQLAANTFQIVLYPPEIRGGAGGGGVACPACTANSVMLWNGTQLANSSIVDNGSGVTIGSPTGGAKGVGTLNATALYSNNVLVNPSNNNIASYTGSVGITGNQTIGADQISNLCVNGICPITAFGADSTNTTDSQPAFTAALAKACSLQVGIGDTKVMPAVFAPPGIYKLNSPIWDSCPGQTHSNIRLYGAGRFASVLDSTFRGNIIVASPVNVFSLGGGTLTTSLMTGSGNAFQLGSTSAGFVDLDEVLGLNTTTSPYSGPFNGLPQFDIRGSIVVPDITVHNQFIWASDGRLLDTLPGASVYCENATGTCGSMLYIDTSGVVHFNLNVNGTLVKLTSGATTVTSGNCYEYEGAYDGADVSLYLGGNSTASCASAAGTVTRVAQTAATGNVTQPADEANTLFADVDIFPFTINGTTGGADNSLIADSIQISNTARHAHTVASYTQDVAKFTTDSNTLFLWNFDQTPTFASNSPIAKVTTPANAFLTWHNAGLGCCGGTHEISDLLVQGSNNGGIGIFADAAILKAYRVYVSQTGLDGITTTPNAAFGLTVHDSDAYNNWRFGFALLGGIGDVQGLGNVSQSLGFIPIIMSSGRLSNSEVTGNAGTYCETVMEGGQVAFDNLIEDPENGGTFWGVCISSKGQGPYTIDNSTIIGSGNVAAILLAPVNYFGSLLLQGDTLTSAITTILDTATASTAGWTTGYAKGINLDSNKCNNSACLNGYHVTSSDSHAVPYCLTGDGGSVCYAKVADLPTCGTTNDHQNIVVTDASVPCLGMTVAVAGGTNFCETKCNAALVPPLWLETGR